VAWFEKQGKLPRGAAHQDAHQLRPRDAAGDGLLQRDRELLAAPRKPQAGRAAVLPDRLLPEGLPPDDRREPRHRCRRSAGCTTATARASRRWSISASGCPRRSTTGRRASRSSSEITGQTLYVSATPAEFELKRSSGGRRAGDPADGAARPRDRRSGPPRGQVEDLIGEIKAAAAAGERVLVTTLTKRLSEDLTGYLRERRSGSSTCTPTSTRSSASRSCATCGWAISTSWSGSTCCARASTCRRWRWSRSWTPTRRGSCGARRASSRRRAARRATRRAGSSSTPTDHRLDPRTIEVTNYRRERQIAYNREHGIVPRSVRRGAQAACTL
jgi:hypothetical protein